MALTSSHTNETAQDLEEFLSVGIEAVRKSSQFLLENFGSQKKVQEKESLHSIVTHEDLHTQEIILSELNDKLPSHSVMSEEMEDEIENRNGKYIWVVDPLDGSSYYSRGISSYSISIALIKDNAILMGIVGCPSDSSGKEEIGDIYYAVNNQGAFLNGNKISVSPHENVNSTIAAIGHRTLREGFGSEQLQDLLCSVMSIRGGGSCAQDMCYIAAGKQDILIKKRQSIWDYAAGLILVEEAGGKVSDLNGNAIEIAGKGYKDCDIVATNSYIHSEVIEITSEI